MANLEHLQELEKGSNSWKKWLLHLDSQGNARRNIDLSSFDLSEKDLSEYDFAGVNLQGANLRSSTLTHANFLLADLSGANLSNAKIRQSQFNQANLEDTNFSNADLFRATFVRTKLNRANLREIDGRETFFAQACCIKTNFTGAALESAGFQETNLKRAIFCSADLFKTDFSFADLTEADFQEANLTIAILNGSILNNSILINANMTGLGAWGANFTDTDFTGACIEGWRIDNTTKFKDVKCTHIYLKSNKEERIPYNSEIDFKSGEFEKFITKAQNTVDLIFTNGIDWQAFLQSFLKLKSKTGEELSIYSIEDKWDNYFVVRVNVPPDVNKKVLEEVLKREYELKEEKKFLQQCITSLTMSVNFLSETQRKQSMSGDIYIGDHAIVSIAKDKAILSIDQINKIFEKPEDISEIAAEIQKLLTQFQNQGLSEKDAQEQVAYDLATKAKSDPTMMEKLKSLGASFTSVAFKAMVGEAAKVVVKLALEKSGIHLK